MVTCILAQVKKPLPAEWKEQIIPQASSWNGLFFYRFYIPLPFARRLMWTPASEDVQLICDHYRKNMGWKRKKPSLFEEYLIGKGLTEIPIVSQATYPLEDTSFKDNPNPPIPDLSFLLRSERS